MFSGLLQASSRFLIDRYWLRFCSCFVGSLLLFFATCYVYKFSDFLLLHASVLRRVPLCLPAAGRSVLLRPYSHSWLLPGAAWGSLMRLLTTCRCLLLAFALLAGRCWFFSPAASAGLWRHSLAAWCCRTCCAFRLMQPLAGRRQPDAAAY